MATTFDRDDTKAKVISIVAQKLKVDAQKIGEAKSLEDLGADSLDMVELIMKFEEQFGIMISDDDAEKICSIHDAIEYIHGRRTK